MARRFSFVYVVAVCCILLTPAILSISGAKDPVPFFDNRVPAKQPRFDISNLDAYPKPFENFFNDHFPFRNSSIALLNYSDAAVFNKSPVPSLVTIGTGGWMYPGATEMEFLLGQEPLTDEMVTVMIEELNDRYEKCRVLGAEFRLVIIPAKSSLYPEHLPLTYQFTQWKRPMEVFMKRCTTECKVPVLYLLDSLIPHKQEQDLFLHCDSHWSDAGMYYSYRSIVNWMNKGTGKLPENVDLTGGKEKYVEGNYGQMLGMPEYWAELTPAYTFPEDTALHTRQKENYPCDDSWFGYCDEYEIPWQNSDTTLPGLLVMRDSYCNPEFQALLSSHFGRSTYIWDYWQFKLNKEIVAKEKPGVVMCLMSESFLLDIMKYRNQGETGGSNYIHTFTVLGRSMNFLSKKLLHGLPRS